MTGADGRWRCSPSAASPRWRRGTPGEAVPILGRDAARATLDEGAAAILLDLASPSFTVVETDDVEHLAAGHRLVQSEAGPAWVS